MNFNFNEENSVFQNKRAHRFCFKNIIKFFTLNEQIYTLPTRFIKYEKTDTLSHIVCVCTVYCIHDMELHINFS